MRGRLATAILCSAAMLTAPHFGKRHKSEEATLKIHRIMTIASDEMAAFRSKQINCVAQAVYFEARGESKTVQRMVADVVINRAENPKFPDTPCEVVQQRHDNVCQFSWNCHSHVVTDVKAWDESKLVAEAAIDRKDDHTHGAMYFRTHKARFKGMKPLRVTRKSGKMVFLAVR